jgi:hypothetical protein
MTIQTTNQSKYRCGVTNWSGAAEVLLSAGWAPAQAPDPAAYTLTSLSARGFITVSFYDHGGLQVKVASGSCSQTWPLPSLAAGYHLLANPYGMFLAPVEPTYGGSRDTTYGVFATVPCIEDGVNDADISTCALVVELNSSLGAGTTHQSFLWLNNAQLADASFVAGDTSWGAMQWQTVGAAGLLTTMGHSIQTPAALFLPYAGSGGTVGACPVRRAGYFWDSILVSEYLTRGQVVQQDGFSWMATLSQTSGDPQSNISTAGSLLWRIDEEI